MPSSLESIVEAPKLAEISGGEIIAAILVMLLYLSSFISILCFMLAIIAKMKNPNNVRLPELFSKNEELRIQGKYMEYLNIISKYDLVILDEFLLTNKRNRTQRFTRGH